MPRRSACRHCRSLPTPRRLSERAPGFGQALQLDGAILEPPISGGATGPKQSDFNISRRC